MKRVISVFAMAIAACAVEPTAEQETSVMAQSIDESRYGGVADCGTKTTPPCPMDAVSLPYGGVPDCGTYDTPPCPMAAAPVPHVGIPECGTWNTAPCPVAAAESQPEWQTCGTEDTPSCPMDAVSPQRGRRAQLSHSR